MKQAALLNSDIVCNLESSITVAATSVTTVAVVDAASERPASGSMDTRTIGLIVFLFAPQVKWFHIFLQKGALILTKIPSYVSP